MQAMAVILWLANIAISWLMKQPLLHPLMYTRLASADLFSIT